MPIHEEAAAKSRSVAAAETAQTLDRGLKILEFIADAGIVTTASVAAHLHVSRSITYRLLTTLQVHRYVEKLDDTHYQLGVGLLNLVRNVRGDLQSAALPEMRRLTEDLGSTTVLTIADGEEAMCLLCIEPPTPHPRIAYRPGFRHPLNVTASGMAILAARPAQPGERPEITRARKRGWSRSSGDLAPGVGVAAPIRLRDGTVNASVAALSLQGRDESKIAPLIVETTERIAERLF